jgi:hypothetical protein
MRVAAPSLSLALVALCGGCLDLRPAECDASSESQDVDVACTLNDGRYECECDGASSTEFDVAEFCELDSADQEDVIADECELDIAEGEGEGEACTPTFSYDAGFGQCTVDFDCGGGQVRQILCDDFIGGDTCDCSENGFDFSSFSNDGFCELVLAASDGDTNAGDQVIVRSGACGFE